MRASFEPREAFYLYFIILGFLIGFFVIGLYLGKGFFVEANQQSELTEEMTSDSESVEDLSSELEFYDNLSTPVDIGGESDPPTESPGRVNSGESEDSPPAQDNRGDAAPEQDLPIGRGNYTIQVAAFSTEAEAEQTRLRLEAKDFPASILRPGEVPGDPFYRVWVGRYQSLEEAQAAELKLKDAGFSTYVRKVGG